MHQLSKRIIKERPLSCWCCLVSSDADNVRSETSQEQGGLQEDCNILHPDQKLRWRQKGKESNNPKNEDTYVLDAVLSHFHAGAFCCLD